MTYLHSENSVESLELRAQFYNNSDAFYSYFSLSPIFIIFPSLIPPRKIPSSGLHVFSDSSW